MKRIEVMCGDCTVSPKPAHGGRAHFRRSLHRLWRNWAGYFGRPSASECHVITALPAHIETESGCLTMRLMIVADPNNLYVFSGADRLIVEGWTKSEALYGDAGDTIRETIHRRFQRTYSLPWAIQPNSVQARIQDCVLAITARRSAPERN